MNNQNKLVQQAIELLESLPVLYQDRHTRGEDGDQLCPFCGEYYRRDDKMMLNHFSDCPLLTAGKLAAKLRESEEGAT